jgi:hypothetical protein
MTDRGLFIASITPVAESAGEADPPAFAPSCRANQPRARRATRARDATHDLGIVLVGEHANDHSEKATDLGHGRDIRSCSFPLIIVRPRDQASCRTKALVERFGRPVRTIRPHDRSILSAQLREERRVAERFEHLAVQAVREIDFTFEAVAELQPNDVCADGSSSRHSRQFEIEHVPSRGVSPRRI